MKEGKNRVVVIIPWYGKLPPYFGAYLNSLEGKDLDVLWVSDAEVKKHPANLIVIRKTFEEVKKLMEEKLKTPIVIDTAQRISDFKPMFGKVFEDYIGDYEYWGWGDCDLVYGRKFNDFLKKTLEVGKYDVISMRKEYLSGPVCFLRNTTAIRELYMKADNWRENCARTGSIRLLFDECGGEFHSALNDGTMTLEDCSKMNDSMSAVVWRTMGLNVYKADDVTEEALQNGEVVKMEDDVLTLDGREISVFHYILAKVPHYFTYVDIPYRHIRKYRIDKTGFYVGGFAWATRFIRSPWREAVAALKSLRRHGLRHVLRHLGI